MLPILTFLGLAFAASLWPDSTTEDSAGPETASDDLSASSTNTSEDDDENSPLSFASASPVNAIDTLAAAAEADIDPADQQIEGSASDDTLFGEDGNDTITGGAGADQLDGGDGNDVLYGDDDAEGDELIGGDDHDQLWLGANDTATGGSGDDIFHMQADTDGASVITDYNPDDDTVAVYYDPTGPVPELKTEQSEDGVRLLADDELLAVFSGATQISLADIQLVPETAAA